MSRRPPLNRTEAIQFVRRQPRWRWLVALGVALGLAWFLWPSRRHTTNGTTFTARRGNLPIAIIEGGSVEALESQEIRSEIKGFQGTKILKIVEEGYLVTDEDVQHGKVLVELDSSELKQRVITEEIQFQSTLAGLTESQQAYDIQLNQNKSDIAAAELKAKFALMDFQKFVGDKLAAGIVERLGLREEVDTNAFDLSRFEMALATSLELIIHTNTPAPPSGNGNRPDATAPMPGSPPGRSKPDARPEPSRPAGAAAADLSRGSDRPRRPRPPADSNEWARVSAPEPDLGLRNGPAMNSLLPRLERSSSNNPLLAIAFPTNKLAGIDFSQYAKPDLLQDGAAKQQLRKLMDDWQMAQAQEALQLTKLQGAERLRKKDFVTKSELETEQMTYTNNLLKTATAKTSLDLFIKYEFPKQAEEFLSKYDEGLRALERTRKEAISKMAQSLAKMRAAEGRFRIEQEQLRDFQEQLEKCTIRAQKTGLVVYAGESERWGGGEQIREGATVRERQRIITIPDTKTMSVRVKIHESHIKKITPGLPARVTVDAFADEQLTGEVSKVGVLPDAGNRWMNPDLKVYLTTIDIHEVRDWLKPGMSAKVEIMVKTLTNIVYIPLQAVSAAQGRQVCYVADGGAPEMRIIDVGDFNDEFIVVKSGLKDGEKVLLNAPEGERTEAAEEELAAPPENGKTIPPPAGPAAQAERPAPRRERDGGPSSDGSPRRQRAPRGDGPR